MILMSFSGTLRMILVLLLVWVVLRFILKLQGRAGKAPRRKGDVRIENDRNSGKEGSAPQGDIIDADFEEIK